jgi:hypothetical protein
VKIISLAGRLLLVMAAPLILLVFGLLAVYQHPLPPLDYPGFESCMLPCWGGITPGETRTADSPQVVVAQFTGAEFEFSQLGGMQTNFTVNSEEGRLDGVIYDDRGTVNSLRIMVRLPLWRLMETLGAPQCVSSQTYPDGGELVSLWWVNDNHTISSGVILPPPPEWNASAQVFTLAIFKDTERCNAPDVKPWRGFAPLWFYRLNRAG